MKTKAIRFFIFALPVILVVLCIAAMLIIFRAEAKRVTPTHTLMVGSGATPDLSETSGSEK